MVSDTHHRLCGAALGLLRGAAGKVLQKPLCEVRVTDNPAIFFPVTLNALPAPEAGSAAFKPVSTALTVSKTEPWLKGGP